MQQHKSDSSEQTLEREKEPSTSPKQGSRREGAPTRSRSNPRKNPVIAVEQSHHIQEVNVQQTEPHATNAAKKKTTAVYSGPRARMSKSMG